MQSDMKYAELEAASDRIAAGQRGRRDEGMLTEITVWMCPAGHHYAATGTKDLSKLWTGFKGMNGEPTPGNAHTRARCMDCAARGVNVNRTPVRVRVRLPTESPPDPPRPANFLANSL